MWNLLCFRKRPCNRNKDGTKSRIKRTVPLSGALSASSGGGSALSLRVSLVIKHLESSEVLSLETDGRTEFR